MCKKRGQITLFIILGVILVIGTGIGLYFLNMPVSEIEDKEVLNADTAEIDNYIESCLAEASDKLIKEIVRKGGTFEDIPNRLYTGFKYNYFCNYLSGKGYINKLITRDSMERELNNAIENEISFCSLDPFREMGYQIETGQINVNMTIGTDDSTVLLEYPITSVKGDETRNFQRFSYVSKLRIGKIYDLIMKILNDEISYAHFDEDEWMRQYSDIEIEKHKPYPDTIYALSIDTGDSQRNLTFRFAVQGRDTASNPSLSLYADGLSGVCYVSRDNNCYFNVNKENCNSINGEWSFENRFECNGLSRYSAWSSPKNCGVIQHGESICAYEGISGNGFDAVGSRHFKQSCFDGEIYYTECADFRQEICTTYEPGKSTCRVNRWQDCTMQDNKEMCENTQLRDCYWADYLVKLNPYRTVTYDYSNRKCLPYVPPGFRFWEGAGQEVCRLANEQGDCDDVHCPMNWVDSTGLYCYFMGDCGNYFNYQKKLSFGGFSNSDGKPRNYIYTVPMTKSSDYLISLPYSLNQQLTGNEFLFEEGIISNMKNKEAAWKQRMDSSNHVSISILPPKIEVDFDSIHSAYCYPWESHLEGIDCSGCMSEPDKPCSEYRCKSISSNCIYSEPNGEGMCGYEPFVESNANFIFDGAYLLNDGVNPKEAISDALNGTLNREARKLSLEADGFEGWNGYEISDIAPYKKILLIIKADVPINCKISELPYADFSRLPNAYDSYFRTVPILIDAKSIMQQKENAIVNQKMANPLEIFSLGEQLSSNIDESAASLNSLDMAQFDGYMQEWGLDFNLFNLSARLEESRKNMDTRINPFMENYRDLNQGIFIAMESNRAYNFIECSDINGNFKNRFFIAYNLLDDTQKPLVLEYSPEISDEVPENFKLELGFNEPVECRYDYSLKSFDSLLYSLECSMTSDYGIYYCFDDVNKGNLFIRCKDQPVNIEEYFLNIVKSNVNNISGIMTFSDNDAANDFTGIELNGSKLIVTSADALNTEGKIIYSKYPNLSVELQFSRPKSCRIKERDSPLAQDLNCDWKGQIFVCSAGLLIQNESNYNILCQNDIIGQRNENSFVLGYTT